VDGRVEAVRALEDFRRFRDGVNNSLDGIKKNWWVNVNVRTVSQQGSNYGKKIGIGGRGGRAEGGGVRIGASYQVNEMGQELLKMTDRSAAVIPHAQSQRMLRHNDRGGGDTYIIQAGTVVPERDLMRLLDRLNARGVRSGARVPVSA
jgi:hypothetical protein